MKKERFFELLADTDDDLLLAAEQKAGKRKPPLLRFAAVAACLCVLMVTVTAIAYHSKKPAAYTYSGYEISGLDCNDGGAHADEHPTLNAQSMNYHQDSTAPKTVTVSFNGVTYIGVYRYSYMSETRMYLAHKYKTDDAYFEINAETGELCAWSAIVTQRPAATVTQERCRPVADRIAAQFINVGEYHVRERFIENGDNYFCKYTYYKEIDGLPTSDSIIVSIDGNGKPASLRILSPGSVNQATARSIDQDAARAAVEQKLTSIYSRNDSNVFHHISLSSVTVLDNGDIALMFTVENEFTNQGSLKHSAVNILVIQSINE